MKLRLAIAFALCLLLTPTPRPCQAAFHFWFIKEAYTNQSGSVQFIEMFTNSPGQNFTNGQIITSNTQTFTFSSNTSTPTNGHHLLIATTGFGSIPGGATPDFTLPDHFFNPAGDTLTFAPDFSPSGPADLKTFASAPTDGVNSLNYLASFSESATIATNTPRNYAGGGTSVNLPPPSGDYNGNHAVDAGDYVVWRKTFNATASPAGSGADGDSSGKIDAGDFTYWRARFGNPAGSGTVVGGSIPEPATIVLLLVGCISVNLLFGPQPRFLKQFSLRRHE